MPSTASPYGLRPVKRIDGLPYAGAVSHYLIDPAGEGTNIFNGQVVIIGADGYIAISTATGADLTTNNLGGSSIGALGVFVGCSYVNAQGQQIYSQYYPSGTTGVCVAYVVDDPMVVFQAQASATMDLNDLGFNTFFAAVQGTNTGSTRTGNSTSALDPTGQAAAAAFAIVGFVSPPTDTYPDILVKFNPGAHRYMSNTGL